MNLQLSQDLGYALIGVASAVLQIAIGHLLAVAFGYASSPLRAAGRWLIDVSPGPIIDVTIALLRSADKPVIFWGLTLIWLASAGLAGWIGGSNAAATALIVTGALGLAAALRRPELPRLGSFIMATAAAIAGPAAVLFLSPTTTLAAAGGALLAASAINAIRRRSGRVRAVRLPVAAAPLGAPNARAALPVEGISPLFTPTKRFYITDVTFPSPRVDPRTWTLEVTGLVAQPLRLSLEAIYKMAAVEVDATLICVHNPVGGDRIGTARWQGVPLASLLKLAGVSEQADHVLIHSVDGYSGGISLSLLDRGFEPLVVYGMNGEPLPREHGAPVRLLVPGIYGYDANVKWLKRLELTRFELARDYWERRGWPREPSRVKTQSRIDVPHAAAVVQEGPQVVAGVAWSPPRGVTRVELSVDDGHWQVCELADELSPSAWRQWQFLWDASPGRHTLRVRAWSPEGVQMDGDGAPFPSGASGYHCVITTVVQANARRNALDKLTTGVRERLHLAWVSARAWRSYHRDLK
jgi:DMSO/TMAO reductase YedYZ molybdopterin-dependent catalytic subunit